MVVTYLLWLFLGLFGIHHLYLGRVNHAIVWFVTFGGFGVGWLRDLWNIPRYRRQAQDQLFNAGAQVEGDIRVSWFRRIGMVVISIYAGAVFSRIFPECPDENTCGSYVIAGSRLFYVIGSLIGVYFVANIEELTTPVKARNSAIFSAIYYGLWMTSTLFLKLRFPLGIIFAFLFPVLITSRGSNRRRRNGQNPLFAASKYFLCCFMWLSVLAYGLHYNTNIEVDGEEIPLGDVFKNVYRSSVWENPVGNLKNVYHTLQHDGMEELLFQLKDIFDVKGQNKAYYILNLSLTASEKEIRVRCRSLSKEYHPDRYKDQKDKDEAQEKFSEIQIACEALSSQKAKRKKLNRRSETTDRETIHTVGETDQDLENEGGNDDVEDDLKESMEDDIEETGREENEDIDADDVVNDEENDKNDNYKKDRDL